VQESAAIYPRPNLPGRLGDCVAALGLGLTLFLAAALPATIAHAQDDDPGRFEVRSANATLEGGVYYLDARLEYRLSTDARAALESGLPLMIRLEIELLHRRPFWVDTETARLEQLFEVEYHAVTERYIIRNLNSGEQASFATLFSALTVLGRIDKLPLIDVSLLDPDNQYDVRIRTALDTEQLPGPLRLLAFWRRDWSLASEWFRWRLQDD
jgi:hypothetical protein